MSTIGEFFHKIEQRDWVELQLRSSRLTALLEDRDWDVADVMEVLTKLDIFPPSRNHVRPTSLAG